MPARASWKGFLQVNQLSLGVKAFSACSSQPEIQLNQLHRSCGQRIEQQKRCPVHGALTSAEIISGYQYAEGCYLPIESSELDALAPEDLKSIEVQRFVPNNRIDVVFHSGRTYYLTPDGPPSQRPFAVLREGMRQSDRHAVAQVVIAGRELLVLLRPLDKLVAMTVLQYSDRVRPAADYETEVASIQPGVNEQELVGALIAGMSDDDFPLDQYRDNYIASLDGLIAQKLAERPADAGEELVDDEAIIAALRASLAATPQPVHRARMERSQPRQAEDRKLG